MKFTKSFRDLARAKQAAEEAFDKAFFAEYKKVRISGDLFWKLLEKLRDELDDRIKDKRFDVVEEACEELFRLAVVSPDKVGYTYDDALVFAKTWESYYGAIYDAIRPLYDGSEDSANDAAESIPFLGKDFVNDGQIVIRVYDDQEEIVGQHGYADEPSDTTIQDDALAIANALHFTVTAQVVIRD